MSLFLNTSSLNNLYSDCCSQDVGETIERDCLSVLHKLHDQVNGLQLVQVVVQPLARLFNPASLAALAANSQSSNTSIPPTTLHLNTTTVSSASLDGSTLTTNVTNNPITFPASNNNSNATTPSSINSRNLNHQQDLDGVSTTSNTLANQPQNNSTSTKIDSHQNFTSTLASNNSNHNNSNIISNSNMSTTNTTTSTTNTSLLSTTSTYMMSPDTAQALIARLDTDRDVNWLMEIIGYGLSMPFSLTGEQDSVKDCCTIYCEWLVAALLPYNEQNEDTKYQQLSKLVPSPIRMDPNRYARKMLSHLYNVFLPRQTFSNNLSTNQQQKEQTDANLTAVSRQAVLCHRVLRTIEKIAQNQNNLMDNETWDHFLALLLTVNDKLLSVPTEQDDIGTQLHDRTLGVLFDLVLLASSKCIPSPNLWRTFHEMSLNWRHRPALVDHWKRVTLLLTKRIVMMPSLIRSGGGNQDQFMRHKTENSNAITNPIELAIAIMSYENLSQTWYRFLNLIGNPVELSDPNIISRTDEFYYFACSSDNVLDPRQHPCLNALPQIFMNSIRGLKDMIETFLGSHQLAPSNERSNANQTSSLVDRYQKSSSVSSNSSRVQHFVQPRPSLTSLTSGTSQQKQQILLQPQFKLSADRPKCNSILHVFGDWLFSAALIGSDLSQKIVTDTNDCSASESVGSFGSTSTTTEVSGMRSYTSSIRKKPLKSQISLAGRRPSQGSSKEGSNSEKITLDPLLTHDSFEAGQAEAMAILCKIFSSKSSTEDVSPTYLSRFYLCLQHCLDSRHVSSPIRRQLLSSVLINSTTILQKDLDGINLLVPSFINAIEFVFECNEREMAPVQAPPRQHNRSGSVRSTSANQTSNYDLRRACILTLMNLLTYPFHFQDLVIRNCLNDSSPTTTFGSLRPRLLKLLFVALQTETDPTNMQILFGGLSLTIHDLASNTNRISNGRSRDQSCHKSRHKNDNNSSNNSDSTNNSLDSTANQQRNQDDTTSQNSFVFNSSGGFLLKSLHVTCHLLINVWKQDTQVSLAALELLTTIARVSTNISMIDDLTSDSNYKNSKINNNNNNLIEMKNEYKQTTRWICDYICNQCSRPPPAHSRDMHSTIVAAYQCLSVWIYNHAYLLNDDNCLNTLMEVIELGVCGQKSKFINNNTTSSPTMQSVINKADKIMKPSSMRVREAAESLLNICMVRARMLDEMGHKITISHDTNLDEHSIVEMTSPSETQLKIANSRFFPGDELKQNEVYKSFRYFSDQDSIIFALYDKMNHDSSLKDSLICLLRTPFGKHCWKIKFVYYTDKSREKIITNKTLGLIKRPFQQITPSFESRMFPFPSGQNKSLYFNQKARFFPETIDHITTNELDHLVLTLDDYTSGKSLLDQRVKNDLDKIGKIFKHQILAEQKVLSDCSIRIKKSESEEPQATNDLDTVRILVAHFGLTSGLNSITPIKYGEADRISNSFVNDLKSLDRESVRTSDSVNIFYIKKNRTNPKEIIESVRQRHNVSLSFFEWILELGQATVVKNHERYFGRISNSRTHQQGTSPFYSSPATTNASISQLKEQQASSEGIDMIAIRNQMLISDHGGSIFDGERMMLYWSDMCQELTFMVPHKLDKIDPNVNIIICWLECPDDIPEIPSQALLSPPSSSSSSSFNPSSMTTTATCSASNDALIDDGSNASTNSSNNTVQTPTSNRAQPKAREYAKYFISTMKNGLYQVNLETSFSRNWLALPLVDGMTVSKGVLSNLIRESILNLCRRRRLYADSYQPPHVKRRIKIQDICNSYKMSSRYDSAEFYNNLFKN